jgi:hypothetical protein
MCDLSDWLQLQPRSNIVRAFEESMDNWGSRQLSICHVRVPISFPRQVCHVFSRETSLIKSFLCAELITEALPEERWKLAPPPSSAIFDQRKELPAVGTPDTQTLNAGEEARQGRRREREARPPPVSGSGGELFGSRPN